MDSTEVTNRILKGIDEDPASPSAGVVSEIRSYINEGQELFAWLSLCLETTATLNLSGTFGTLRPSLPDYLAPLKMTINGRRIRPATLSDLDALSTTWQSTLDIPQRYCTLGFNFVVVYPQEATSVQLTYARAPVPSVNEDIPLEIEEQYHPALVSYGIYRTRLKEGAQGLERGLKYFGEFLDDAQRCGDFVRARSRAAKYDVLPLELKLFDRSRLMLQPEKPKRGR